jgi:hypothetical protein
MAVGAREHSLHGAVHEGNVALIRGILLAHPDLVNKPLSETFRQEPFAFAACVPHFCLSSNGGDYALHVAVFAGRLEVIRLLIHAGADVNIQSR